MKKYIGLFFLLHICFYSSASSIKFVTTAKSWNEILTLAKKSNKKIFVDVYTTWCGPCKKMDMEVFSQTQVAEFYNTNFINIKIDAEKGWGITFSKTNQVNAYPTYLFFNPDGKINHTALGYIPTQTFLSLGNQALKSDASSVSLTNYARLYNEGKYSANMLYNYIKTAGPIPHNRDSLLQKYLSVLPYEALSTDSVQALIYTKSKSFSPSGIIYTALLAGYRKNPYKNGLLNSPWNSLRSRIIDGAEHAGKINDLSTLEKLIQANMPLENTDFARQREDAFLRCIFFATRGNAEKFSQSYLKFHQMIQNVDTINLYQSDLKEFNTFTQKNPVDSSIKPEMLKVSFRSETYRTLTELSSILYFYNTTPQLRSKTLNNTIKESMYSAIYLYQHNPIHVIPFLITQGEKAISNL